MRPPQLVYRDPAAVFAGAPRRSEVGALGLLELFMEAVLRSQVDAMATHWHHLVFSRPDTGVAA